MEGLYILSVVAMTAGVVGLAFKISRYIYLCMKTNQRVVIEAAQYEVNAVRQFNPLEQVDEPTPKITNKPKTSDPLDQNPLDTFQTTRPFRNPPTKHIWTIARQLTYYGTNRSKTSGPSPDNSPITETNELTPLDTITHHKQ
jgi:hypothetical protein